MKKDLLHHFSDIHLKSIERHLGAYLKDKRPQRLHKLRIDIKKIRSVFHFVEKTNKIKYPDNVLNPVFQNVGKLRELQIGIRLLNKLSHPPQKLITRLKKKEDDLKEQLIKLIPCYSKTVKSFRKKVILPSKFPNKKKTKSFFKKAFTSADKILLNNDRRSVHHFRMKIKKIMYVYNILPHKLHKEIKLNTSEITKLQSKIGKWHDHYSALNFLRRQHFSGQISKYIAILKEKENRQFFSLIIDLQTMGGISKR